MKETIRQCWEEGRFGKIEELLREDPSLMGEAAGLLAKSDSDAISALLQVAGRVGFDFPEEARVLCGTIVTLMGSGDPFVRMDAAQAFATLCSQERANAEEGLPLISRLLDDENPLVRGDAAGAVGNIGFYFPDLVVREARRLLEMLEHSTDDDEREAVAHALGKIGATNPDLLKEIFPTLVHALEKTREASCGGILLAFGTVGLHYPDMVGKYVPKLIEYLQSSNDDTVRYAVLAIGNIATNRPDLVAGAAPHLQRIGEVADHDLRVNARMALSMMGR